MADLLGTVISISMASHLQITKNSHCNFSCHYLKPSEAHGSPYLSSFPKSTTLEPKSWKLIKPHFSAAFRDQSDLDAETLLPPMPKTEVSSVKSSSNCCNKMPRKNRVFFLDVSPLCYRAGTPSLHSFAHWISLFFSNISLNDPVIAEFLMGIELISTAGNYYHRTKQIEGKCFRDIGALKGFQGALSEHHMNLSWMFFGNVMCQVLKIELHEADDVIATLVHQVLLKRYRAVIASPDKDFKQLLSEDVQIVTQQMVLLHPKVLHSSVQLPSSIRS
ncbi:hypothetical protein OROMI_030808 [Orobanche minor]